jgi:electron transfer flavoprotein beta subunit
MDILVCVKRVPATDSTIKVGSDGKSIDPSGVEFVPNPYDEFAVEEGHQDQGSPRRRSHAAEHRPGRGQEGPAEVPGHGRRQGGAADGRRRPAPTPRASRKPSPPRSKELNPQIIFVGKQSVDNDDAQVGPRMAALLGWACASDVTKLEIDGDTFKGERDIEGGKEAFEGKLPAVITCNKGLNEPRFANLKGIMQAKKKPFETADAELAAPAAQLVELSPPPARPEPTILGEGPEAVAALIDKLKNEAKVL